MKEDKASNAPQESKKPFMTAGKLLGYLLLGLSLVMVELQDTRFLLAGAAVLVGMQLFRDRRDHVRDARLDNAHDTLVELQAELETSIGDCIGPIGELLGQISSEPPEFRSPLKAQLTEKVVSVAAHLCGPPGTRASYFAVRETADSTHLSVEASAGRGDHPRTTFRPGDASGDHVLGLLERRRSTLVRNTLNPPEGVPALGNRSYETYVAAPVYAGDTDLGLLTIDAPERGSLDERHRRIAEALAKLLGAGLGVSS